ncbi:MAG: tetratricopeptide repeat protein, partial [Candidatus Edwardsbacteria bacterium]|nr:tetratricopeptide repeat protein [Candidatus Edwardsbacteria bacterium]
GNKQKAIEYLEKAVKLEKDFSEANCLLGLIYAINDRHSTAIFYFNRVIESDPNYDEIYFSLALSYGKLRNYTEAIEAFKKAIDKKPGFIDAYLKLSQCYCYIGQYNEAKKVCFDVLEIEKDRNDIHYNLGLIYLLLEDKYSALNEYETLKHKDISLAEKLKTEIDRCYK